MGLAWRSENVQAARMDAPDLDLDEVFLDAVDAAVLAALERIGDDPEARFRLVRRLQAVMQDVVQDGRPQ